MSSHLVFHLVQTSAACVTRRSALTVLHSAGVQVFSHARLGNEALAPRERPCTLLSEAHDCLERVRWSWRSERLRRPPPASAASLRTAPATAWHRWRCRDAGRAGGPILTDLSANTRPAVELTVDNYCHLLFTGRGGAITGIQPGRLQSPYLWCTCLGYFCSGHPLRSAHPSRSCGGCTCDRKVQRLKS